MTTLPVLQGGSTGAAVVRLQRRLIAKGYRLGPTGADGIFGLRTFAAVVAYQRKMGLKVDGVVGAQTWGKLLAVAPTKTSAARVADIAYALVTGSPRPAYVFGHEARLTDPHPDELDCSELVEWAIYQVTGVDWCDGSWVQYAKGHHITVAEGIATKGALLFLSTGGPDDIHHVAWSMGDESTAEARSSALGCGSWSAAQSERRWSYAATVPILRY